MTPITLTGSSPDLPTGGSSNEATNLIDCNSDLDGSQKIDSKDAIIMYALVEFVSASSSQSFEDFFDGLVSSGQVPAIDVSSISTSDFLSSAICYDYDLSSSVTMDDVDILSAFAGYMDKLVKIKIDETDANKFRLFIDTLVTQGLWDSADFAGGDGDGDTPRIMLPTLLTDDKIYYTDDTWEPKVDEDDVAYDETNSQEGREVDSSGSNFFVSDPGVKTYYKWNGTSGTWLNTGLCKIFTRSGSELEESVILHPPVDIIKDRTLPTSILPMGIPTIFNGKTIAISGQYQAVSWHYATSGVVYVYMQSDGPDGYPLGWEVQVPGDFSAGLPCIELNGLELFVSNPLDTDDHKIYVYDLSSYSSSGSVSVVDTPTSTIEETTISSSASEGCYEEIGCDAPYTVFHYVGNNRTFWAIPNDATECLTHWPHYSANQDNFAEPVPVGLFDSDDNFIQDANILGSSRYRVNGTPASYWTAIHIDATFHLGGSSGWNIQENIKTCKIKLKTECAPEFSPSGISLDAGFASSMLISDDGTRLFVGSPLHPTNKLGNIDHYDTGMIDFYCGAVFVYTKNSSSGEWSLDQTIVPHDLDTYISNDYDSGSNVDLQFGYSVEASGTKLFIGAPRAYASSNTRREGAVYVYNLTSNEYVHQSTIRHDDAKFDTTSILDGNFNFGISVVSTGNTDAISVLHHIPGQGTRVTKYSLSGNEYIMATTNSYHTISNQILSGMLAIGSDDVSVVYGSQNLLKLLV
jgi:hypothetical protein